MSANTLRYSRLAQAMALFCVASPLYAADATNAVLDEVSVIEKKAEKKKATPPDGTLEKQGYICRTERRMNSRFGNTVCRSPAQIAEEKAMARESVPRHRDCLAPSYMCNG